MAKKEQIKTVTFTFEYFKAFGNVARMVHAESVEVFGVSPEECFIDTESGRELCPELEKMIYPTIRHERHCEKSDYHTVTWKETARPADWVEYVEEDKARKQE